jgi:pilus assembly protein Flp/PilA
MLALWSLWNRIKTNLREEEGQTGVEYALLLALIALAIILANPNLRSVISSIFSNISSGLSSAAVT